MRRGIEPRADPPAPGDGDPGRRSLSLAEKLWLGFGLLILALAVSGLVGFRRFEKIGGEMAQVVSVAMPAQEAALELEINARLEEIGDRFQGLVAAGQRVMALSNDMGRRLDELQSGRGAGTTVTVRFPAARIVGLDRPARGGARPLSSMSRASARRQAT